MSTSTLRHASIIPIAGVPHVMTRPLLIVGVLALALALAFHTRSEAADPPRFEFTRLVAHWAEYGDPDYLKFIEEAKPEVAQVGFYGGHFWSLGHTPQSTAIRPTSRSAGWPSGRLVRGPQRASCTRAASRSSATSTSSSSSATPTARRARAASSSSTATSGTRRSSGPRPVADPLELLEKNADGTPIVDSTYTIGGMKEYWACLSNPALAGRAQGLGAGRASAAGVDGFIVNYFYRHNCLCEHCQAGFRRYLRRAVHAGAAARAGSASPTWRRTSSARSSRWHDPKEIDAAAAGDAAVLADLEQARPSTRSSSSTAAR